MVLTISPPASILCGMFFRLKPTKSGQVLKLIESFRDDTATPRHRTVASLGNAPIAPENWKPIAKAVEDRLYARESLMERELCSQEQQWVDRLLRQVSSEGRWKPLRQPCPQAQVIDGVLADEVSHTETAELGPVLLGWRVWQRLGMPQLLSTLGFSASQSQAAAISVINRLVDPGSEHSLLDWYRRTGLPELLGNKLRGAGDDRFYRVSDLLLTHQGAIEAHMRERQQSMFNLSRTVLLYDLTNSHFEGVCKRNAKAKRGKNKQKRNDCPQIVVGMLFDQFGFEMAHKVFEGSLNDSKSLLEIIGALNAAVGEHTEKPLIIMDAGVATKKNLKLLHEHGFGYLVNDSRGQRKRYLEQFRERELFKVVEGREGKPDVLVRVMDDPSINEKDPPDVPERVVLCRSLSRGSKEQAMLSNAERRFLDELEKLALRIEKGQIKDRQKIQRAIGRMQAKNPRVGRYYLVALTEEAGKLQLQWTQDEEKMRQAMELFGCYVLRTDERTLAEHLLWPLYISLTRAEDGFRALKTDLGLRPNPHHKEERVDSHVFLCVLAYHLLRNILWMLEQKGEQRNWETLKRVLRTHCYTTILMPTNKGQTHRIRKAGQPEEGQKEIYRNLGIDWRGLPCNRSVIDGHLSRIEDHAGMATL